MQPNNALKKMMADIARVSGRKPEEEDKELRARQSPVAEPVPSSPPQSFTLTPASRPDSDPLSNFVRNVGFFTGYGAHTIGSSFMEGIGEYVSPDLMQSLGGDENASLMREINNQIDIDEARYKAKDNKALDSAIEAESAKPLHKVVGEHQEELRKEAATIDVDAMQDLTPESLRKDIETVGRGTGATDLGGAMDNMSKANPKAFEDVARTLKEISGFDGPVNAAVKRGQEMLDIYTKQGIDRLNNVNAGETERWRQLQSKLRGGGGMTGQDKLGFALMAMVPILAKMINRRARVDQAYSGLAQAYSQTASERKAEYADALREYGMISDNVRQGSIQLGQAVNQYIQGDLQLAKALEDSSTNIYKLAEQPGSQMDAKSMVENYVDMRMNSGLADISGFNKGDMETIGVQVALKPLITKMGSVEEKIAKAVQEGRISKSMMDNVLKFFNKVDNGLFALPDRLREHLSRHAPELIEYQQIANQAIAIYVKSFSGASATDAEREFIKKFVAIGGYASPETMTSLQRVRRDAYNTGLAKLSPAMRQRARVDHIITQLGGDEKVRRFVKGLGGTIDIQNGTVTNVRVNVGGKEQYVKGLPIEDFFYMMKSNDPRFEALQLQLMFEE